MTTGRSSGKTWKSRWARLGLAATSLALRNSLKTTTRGSTLLTKRRKGGSV